MEIHEVSDMNSIIIIVYRDMKECRRDAAAAVVNRKIFISGGSNVTVIDSAECYDPSSDVWTQISNMPQKIWGHCAVEMNGNFIVMGGYNREKFFNNVWALNTTDKNAAWIEKPSMSTPHSYFSIAKVEDKIFVCGGWGEGDIVETFDGETWRNGPKMPTSRYFAPVAIIPIEFARSLS